jgi:hypothetical protein
MIENNSYFRILQSIIIILQSILPILYSNISVYRLFGLPQNWLIIQRLLRF